MFVFCAVVYDVLGFDFGICVWVGCCYCGVGVLVDLGCVFGFGVVWWELVLDMIVWCRGLSLICDVYVVVLLDYFVEFYLLL